MLQLDKPKNYPMKTQGITYISAQPQGTNNKKTPDFLENELKILTQKPSKKNKEQRKMTIRSLSITNCFVIFKSKEIEIQQKN